jgi:hypothetical protein
VGVVDLFDSVPRDFFFLHSYVCWCRFEARAFAYVQACLRFSAGSCGITASFRCFFIPVQKGNPLDRHLEVFPSLFTLLGVVAGRSRWLRALVQRSA